jgi:glycerophosphoryl diester phosphodiesterase
VIENTASAFQAAIAGNYAIETDIQISADGEAMVHHDDALGRLTDGAGRLDTMTAAVLRRIAFKSTADRMLTLGELCDLVAGRVTLLIELKGRFAGDTRLATRTAEVLAGTGGAVAAMSFDPSLMAALRGVAPKLALGLVAMRRDANAPVTAKMSALRYARHAFAARPQFLAYRVQDLTSAPPLIARNLLRWPVLTWTVRTNEDRARAARYADQMIFEGFRPEPPAT